MLILAIVFGDGSPTALRPSLPSPTKAVSRGRRGAAHGAIQRVDPHRRLERELGAVLVDRSAGHLTEEGEAVASRAGESRRTRRAGRRRAALHDEVSGTVRFASSGRRLRWLVPARAERCERPSQRAAVRRWAATPRAFEPQLASGQLDLAVVNCRAGARFDAGTLFDETSCGGSSVTRWRRQRRSLQDLDVSSY